jgi:hypothetical protein
MRPPAWPIETVSRPPGTYNWEPLVTPEQLAQMPPKLRKPTTILGVAVAEMINLLTLYEIGAALNGTKFREVMRPSKAYPTIHNITTCIFGNICIGLDAFSGDRESSVNIKRVINATIQHREPILTFHGQTSPPRHVKMLIDDRATQPP